MAAYELAPTSDWPSQREDLDPKRLEALDKIWYPLLRDYLKCAESRGHVYADNLDVTDGGRDRSQVKHDGVIDGDVIDGRGTFNAEEFKKERSRGWKNKFGMTFDEFSEVLQLADINNTGEINYKDFLKALAKFTLLEPEQVSKLKSFVYAFAYVEEFTCWPPKLFVLLVTLVETVFFIHNCVYLSQEHSTTVT